MAKSEPVPKANPIRHYMDLVPMSTLASLDMGYNGHESIARIQSIMSKITAMKMEGRLPSKFDMRAVEAEADILKRRPAVEAVRESGEGIEGLLQHNPEYEGVRNHYSRCLEIVANAWLKNVELGEAGRVLKNAMSRGDLTAHVAKVDEAMMAYDAEKGKFTYLIPERLAKEYPAVGASDNALFEATLIAVAAGHHEISEVLKIINMGAHGHVDIVHHTLGLVGSVIGPSFEHPELMHKGTSLDDAFSRHKAGPSPEQRQLADRLKTIENNIGQGKLNHESIIAAIRKHNELYPERDPKDLKSAHMAYRLLVRLHGNSPKGRREAINRLFSHKITSEGELERFISGK